VVLQQKGKGEEKMRLFLFVVVLSTLAAVVLAQTQILPNPDMDGCGSAASGSSPLIGWTALRNGVDDTEDRSINVASPSFFLEQGTGPASDTCTAWFGGVATLVLTPNSFVNAAGITSPSLFTFSGWFACDTASSIESCSFSLLINEDLSIPLGTIEASNPAPFEQFTTQITFNPSSDSFSIVGNAPSDDLFGYVTQALLTFDETIEGDPHINLGFMKFDFEGQPNRIYNLISSPSLQVILFFS